MKIKMLYSFVLNKYFLFLSIGITSAFSSFAGKYSDTSYTSNYIQYKEQKIILYYVEGATYKSTFLYNEEIFSYLIDANNKVLFLNQNGEQTNLNLKLFEFVNLADKNFNVVELNEQEPVFFERIVSSENYSKLAKPLTIDYKDIKDDLNVIIDRVEGVNSKDTQYLIFRFDIKEDGSIENARNETSDDSSLHQSILNYLSKLDNWQPSEDSEVPVVSTYEIKIMVPYSYKEKGEIVNEHKRVISKE